MATKFWYPLISDICRSTYVDLSTSYWMSKVHIQLISQVVAAWPSLFLLTSSQVAQAATNRQCAICIHAAICCCSKVWEAIYTVLKVASDQNLLGWKLCFEWWRHWEFKLSAISSLRLGVSLLPFGWYRVVEGWWDRLGWLPNVKSFIQLAQLMESSWDVRRARIMAGDRSMKWHDFPSPKIEALVLAAHATSL